MIGSAFRLTASVLSWALGRIMPLTLALFEAVARYMRLWWRCRGAVQLSEAITGDTRERPDHKPGGLNRPPIRESPRLRTQGLRFKRGG
jgi:hypothetical protein